MSKYVIGGLFIGVAIYTYMNPGETPTAQVVTGAFGRGRLVPVDGADFAFNNKMMSVVFGIIGIIILLAPEEFLSDLATANDDYDGHHFHNHYNSFGYNQNRQRPRYVYGSTSMGTVKPN
jgi:hypothetical protein